MANPYEPPSFDPQKFQDAAYAPPQPQPGFGWVNQVRIVAILNCVQGGLECAMGLMMISFAVVIPMMIRMDPNARPPPPEMDWLLPLIYAGFGTPVLLAGILRIYAGVQNFRYRSRVLGIISIIAGMVFMFGCYWQPELES